VLEYECDENKQREAFMACGELLEEWNRKNHSRRICCDLVGEALDRLAPRNVHPDQWTLKGCENICGDLNLDLTANKLIPVI